MWQLLCSGSKVDDERPLVGQLSERVAWFGNNRWLWLGDKMGIGIIKRSRFNKGRDAAPTSFVARLFRIDTAVVPFKLGMLL